LSLGSRVASIGTVVTKVDQHRTSSSDSGREKITRECGNNAKKYADQLKSLIVKHEKMGVV
jgi:hypothetical protein